MTVNTKESELEPRALEIVTNKFFAVPVAEITV